mmetsp:Transcript_17347/g.60135  ORF Transcript_17347/g.60135 Transcript_17347/m.60135 type:complete len:209 (+) Transcript_17347:1747-2373(+)
MVSRSMYFSVTYVPPTEGSLRVVTKSRIPFTISCARRPPPSSAAKRGTTKRTSSSLKTASSKSFVCATFPCPHAKMCSTSSFFSLEICTALSSGPPASPGSPPFCSSRKSARPCCFFAVKPRPWETMRSNSASSDICASSAAVARRMSRIKSSGDPAVCASMLSFSKSGPRLPCRHSLKPHSSQTKPPRAPSAEHSPQHARGHFEHWR